MQNKKKKTSYFAKKSYLCIVEQKTGKRCFYLNQLKNKQ